MNKPFPNEDNKFDDDNIIFIDSSCNNQDKSQSNIAKVSTNKTNNLYTASFSCPLKLSIDSFKKGINYKSIMDEKEYWKRSLKLLKFQRRKSMPVTSKAKIKSLFYKNRYKSKSESSVENYVNIIIC